MLPSKAKPARGDALQVLWNFAAVGGIGFVIEAILLTGFTLIAGWTSWQARIPSFLTAVLVTWVLNRNHTFAGRGMERRSVEAFLYVALQTCGAAINLAIFGMCLFHAPQLDALPVIPLAIGAIGGFAFNYATANMLLYARTRNRR